MTHPKSQDLMRQQDYEDRMICRCLTEVLGVFMAGIGVGIFVTSIMNWWVG